MRNKELIIPSHDPSEDPLVDALSAADMRLHGLTSRNLQRKERETKARTEQPNFLWEVWVIVAIVAAVIGNGVFRLLSLIGMVD